MAAKPQTGVRAKPAAKKPAARRSPKKTSTAKATTPQKVAGTHLISVFGPFNSRVLIEMSAERAAALFADLGEPTARSRVIDSVEQELQEIRKRAPAIADGQLAATAIALAYELEHPYNSATSKSMCARALNETMDRLRELAPQKAERDGIDELARKRDTRRSRVARKAGASASTRS